MLFSFQFSSIPTKLSIKKEEEEEEKKEISIMC
jgi:hypothetical protein